MDHNPHLDPDSCLNSGVAYCETEDDLWARAFASLLPPGDPWWGDCLTAFRTPGAHAEWQLICFLAARDKRVAAAVCRAIAATRPIDCGPEMLPAHEMQYGLPDPCIGALAAYPGARRDALLAKMNEMMRQRVEDFETYAAAAGYDVDVQESPMPNVSANSVCTPVSGDNWWLHVVVKDVPIYWHNVCQNSICDPLGDFNIDRIVCLLRQVIGPQYHVTFSVLQL